jgi:hypothetical protein
MKTRDNKYFYGKALHSSRGYYAAGTGDHPMGAVRSLTPQGKIPVAEITVFVVPPAPLFWTVLPLIEVPVQTPTA